MSLERLILMIWRRDRVVLANLFLTSIDGDLLGFELTA
jgi:hypothetical protein